MSKYADRFTHRPPQRQRGWSIVGIVAALVAGITLIAALVLASRPTPFVPEVTGAPSLQIEQTAFDYGDVHFGQPVHTVFRIRNVGDKALEILNQPQVQVVKGCCPPQTQLTSRTIWPGQEATITLHFTMHEGMGGEHEFQIPLQTNDPAQADTTLTVLSNWIA